MKLEGETPPLLQVNMAPYPIVGPVPFGTNFPIESDNFQPSQFTISAITLGETTTVTTSSDNNFVVGQNVRLLIPTQCGSRPLNESQGIVISKPASNQVIIDIPSLGMNSFIAAAASDQIQPQILPIGDINSGQINSSGRISNITYVNGSFINIS